MSAPSCVMGSPVLTRMCFSCSVGKGSSGSNPGASFALLCSPPHANASCAWVAGLAQLQLRCTASWVHFLVPDGFVLSFLPPYLVLSLSTQLGFRLFALHKSSAASPAKETVRNCHHAVEVRSYGAFFNFLFLYILKGGRKLVISTENLLLCSTPLEISFVLNHATAQALRIPEEKFCALRILEEKFCALRGAPPTFPPSPQLLPL